MFDANPNIIRDLKNGTGSAAEQGALLLRHETYDHPYPHCWRCRNPLIYRAVSSWFVAVTQFKDRMVELNQQITWYPENVKDGQFGKWLENARDWSVSRNRYWGTPIPVWQSDDPAYPRTDVYGSLDELEADFGVRLDNLHRPYIDELTRPNPDDPTGNSTMRRVPDVLDVWFDSGSMPYAQVHYPFENADWFEHHYPSDFIVEYIGQTRGWFYLLHVLATALFDRPAFRTCVSHGIVLGSDGAEDVQVAAQLPGRQRGLRARRLRRHALVPDGEPDPARRQPGRHRQGHPRRRPPGRAAAVELVLLPRAVRERRGRRRPVAHGFAERAGPVRPGEDARAGHRRRVRDGPLRHRRRVPDRAGLPRGPHELVRPPLAGPVLGG